jgi:hypothetical protein
LPTWLRNCIHDSAIRTDPAGDIKTIAEMRETIQELLAKLEERR